MKVAICEDEKIMADKIWRFFFDRKDVNAKCYLDAERLLSDYENGERYDIVFCDVVMKVMNGIELCRAIRKLDDSVYFCMITNYVEYAPSGYEAGVFRYLLKPVEKEDVLKVLDDIKKTASSSQKIIIKSFYDNMIIKTESLIYIEVKDKYSYVHYWTEENPRREDVIITASSLHHLEETLADKNFCRIHRKYGINPEHVVSYNSVSVQMDCGTALPISYRKYSAFKNAFEAFL
ncbi:MAG: LytTR family DNA-binding domain-containing protein [Lachnospiraceae bacterium]|nr:LytTR family DNA-binding domain-containing protein [Lachnospiraceae bacterium]